MSTNKWEKCPSVTAGGKPFFYIRQLDTPHSGRCARVVWCRDVLAYKASVDRSVSDRGDLVGYYSAPTFAKQACDNFDAERRTS